jgi:uncharacterized protein YdhG (YjbR/CyaY superfamily)
MITNQPTPKNVAEYIADFPVETQLILEELRETIKKAAPEAEEVISYKMPAYKLHGVLVYFAAYKKHIGFYPTSLGIKAFEKELSGYKTSKGAVQFPIDRALPFDLISKIVVSRVTENKELEAAKGKKTHL